MALHFYSQRKSIKDGAPQSVTNKYGDKRSMERQYHLFCANACEGSEAPFDLDSIEWGTIENGIIERKCYVKEIPQPEPEAEAEEE